MDNKYICPKCGKRNWKRCKKNKAKIKCATPYCVNISDN